MGEKTGWEHLRAEFFGGTRRPHSSNETAELGRRVQEEGSKAFSLLKQTVEDDTLGDDLRYHAMVWLVSLYGHPDLDKEVITDTFKQVADTTLQSDRRQLRRDALMALAHLHLKSLPDASNALNFLLRLATDTRLSRYVREDAREALAKTRSAKALEPLALGILERSRKLVQGMQDIQSVEWTDKARTFLELIEKHPITRNGIEASLVVNALIPSQGRSGDPARGLAKIGNFIIEQSRNRNERVAGVLAELLIACEGGDQIQAGHRISEFTKDHDVPPQELESLAVAVGGAPALRGVMGILQTNLEAYFQKPIHELNQNTMASWEGIIASARHGLTMRLWMSGTVFVVGILLLATSSIRMLHAESGALELSTFAPFLAGLGTMLLIAYTGPLKEIRQAVIDLANANAAFIAYVHQILETSHTFSFYYLHERVSFEQIEHSSAIIKRAMMDTIDALSRKAIDSSEDTIAKAIKLGEMVRADDSEAAKSRTLVRRKSGDIEPVVTTRPGSPAR